MSGGSNTDSYVVLFEDLNSTYSTVGLGHYGFETREEAEAWAKEKLGSDVKFRILGFEDLS